MSLFGEIGKVFKGVGKAIGGIFDGDLGSALSMAALAAGVVYTGGALSSLLGGAAGAAGASAGAGAAAGAAGAAGASTAGALSAANAAGLSALSSTAAMTGVASAGLQGYQASAQQEAQEKALAETKRALNEQEITRKKALLAEMTSVAARSNEARNVRNNLQGLSNSKLGGTTQQLGG